MSASTPTASNYSSQYPPSWRTTDQDEELRFERVPRPQYGESVKRHLDNFDLDTALNEVSIAALASKHGLTFGQMAEASSRISKFTEHYKHQSYLDQRSRTMASAVPAMVEVDDMSKQTSRIHDSIARLRTVVQAREVEVAERDKELQAEKCRTIRHEEINASNEDLKSVALSGSEAKKRRGVRLMSAALHKLPFADHGSSALHRLGDVTAATGLRPRSGDEGLMALERCATHVVFVSFALDVIVVR